jgi:diguanylate cyclase (GGDEF)-like protein
LKSRPEAQRGKRLHRRRIPSAARQARTPGARPAGPLEALERIPRPLALAVSIVLVLGIALVNYVSSLDLRFSFFYLLPVALASWLVGRYEGLILSLASAAIWLVQHLRESGVDPARQTTAFLNAVLLFGFFGLFSLLLSALRRALAREKAAARVDPLTEVPNRRAFFELAESEIHRASRYRGRFTVAFLDLDDFKAVNDRKGHAAGDRVLQRIAQAIRGGLRANDVVARLGGDEFVLLLPETGAAEADPVLDKLRHRIGGAQGEEDDFVTVSTGCVTFEAPPGSVDEMLKLVDEVMYSAKLAGGNAIARRVVVDSDRAERADDPAV